MLVPDLATGRNASPDRSSRPSDGGLVPYASRFDSAGSAAARGMHHLHLRPQVGSATYDHAVAVGVHCVVAGCLS